MGNSASKRNSPNILLSLEHEERQSSLDPATLPALCVISNNVSLLKSLQNFGVSMNMRDREENTLLHLSVINESLDVFNFLLKRTDVQINAVNSDGISALTMAVIHDKEYYALKLIEKGANIHIIDKLGCTPLHYAVHCSSNKVCQVLIKNGIEVNVQNLSGETPLYLACRYGISEKICMLLYYGADVSVPCKKGNIPLLIRRVNTLEMYIRVILYYHTFDHMEITIEMKILVRAMVLNWPIFPELINKVNRVIYNKSDLYYLNESLPDIAPQYFKIFIEKFDYVVKDMLYNCCTLTNYLTSIESVRKVKQEFVDFLYILLESPLVYEVIQSCCQAISPISSLVKIFHKNKMSIKTLTGLVCCLLSYGINVTPIDLNAVYVFYGRCELFDIMLHMDIETTNNKPPCCTICDYEVVQESIMAHFIYDIDLNIDKFLERPQWLLSVDLEVLLKYFALPKLKDFFISDCFTGHRVNSEVAKLPTVPYLVELARNSAREHIIRRFHIRNSRQFYTAIKWLPISDVYKRILTFEKKLYYV